MEKIQDILKRSGILSNLSYNPSELTPFEYAKKRAKWANEVQGVLKDYNCKRCLNRGYIMEPKKTGEIVSVRCKCMDIRRSIRILKRSGLDELVRNSTFDKFETDTEWRIQAKELAIKYTKEYNGNWFLASGVPGCGKTHLCVAICREFMLQGMETKYMLWRDEVTKIKAYMNSDKYDERIKEFCSVKVLYIDDFLKVGRNEEPTTADIGVAFEILNNRYISHDLITVISTERSIEELLDIDSALGSRIYERSKGFILRVDGEDKNWRLK